MPPPTGLSRIRTTNALAELLLRGEAGSLLPSEIDDASKLREIPDEERYEKKEREIPRLLREILERDCGPFSRLTKRCFFQEDAWLVRVGCKEGEALIDDGHDVLTRNMESELIPAMVEGSDVSMHFVRIHAHNVFVRTVVLPMMSGPHS